MKRRLVWIAAVLVIAGVIGIAGTLATGTPVLRERRSPVPTAKIVKGPLKLTVIVAVPPLSPML